MLNREVPLPLHPALETLALYCSADLPWFTRLRVGRHIAHCGDCEQQILVFRSAAAELKREANSGTLTGFEAITHWPVLEREMLGNIAVGVDAARCIDKVGHGHKTLWKFGFASGMLALFAGGWLTHIPEEQTTHLMLSLRRAVGLERPVFMGSELRSTPDGIAVRAQGATLTILHPASAVVSMSGPSEVSARYVDEETGQVTVTNVYGQ